MYSTFVCSRCASIRGVGTIHQILGWMWPACHWRNLASQMLGIDGEDLWGPSSGPHLRVQCHLRRRPSDIRRPTRGPHLVFAKSWSPRRAWASRARRAHGATGKGSAKLLGCPRRDSGVTDGAVLGFCLADLAGGQKKKKKKRGSRVRDRRTEGPCEQTTRRRFGEARPGANDPQLRSGSLAGRLTTQS